MRIYRNGDLAFDDVTGDPFDAGQLSGISLGMVALDAEIGQGQLPVPGNPMWVAGDRITIYEQGTPSGGGSSNVTFGGVDVVFGGVQVVWTNNGPTPEDGDYLIYMGYVNQYSRIRNPRSPLEVTTIYNLMDGNRQAIGTLVDNLDTGPGGLTSTGTELAQSALIFRGDVDVDVTWVGSNTTIIPGQIYNSDGMMDLIGTNVVYTGWTIYFVPTDADNLLEFHYHDLVTGPTAGLTIDDTPGAADGITVFAPRDPELRSDPNDLKTRVLIRNGVATVSGGSNATQYNAGGLNWAFNGSYGMDEDSLTLYANNMLLNATEKFTYACTIGPLDGAQIVAIRPGSLITTKSVVFGLGGVPERISRITLTPAMGPTPSTGFWDAHLELSHPTRLPAAALGVGGQGGYSGSLTDPYLNADHFNPLAGENVILGDIPVGAFDLWYFQLVDIKEGVLAIPTVTAFFTIDQWEDEARTITGTGWSLTVPMGADITDTKGQVSVEVHHDSAGTAIIVDVTCSL